jgi:hypothetical protein
MSSKVLQGEVVFRWFRECAERAPVPLPSGCLRVDQALALPMLRILSGSLLVLLWEVTC